MIRTYQTQKLGLYLTAGVGGSVSVCSGASLVVIDLPADPTTPLTLDGGSFSSSSSFINGFDSLVFASFYGGTDDPSYDSSTLSDFHAFRALSPLLASDRDGTYSDLDFGFDSIDGVTPGDGFILGDDNFVFGDFDNNGTFESLFQIDVTSVSEGRVIGLVRDSMNQDIDFADGLAALNESAIPEPSQHVALLGLGAAGLIARRRSKKTA